ncbi:MAG: hypothetical protein ABGZ53_01495 [Fuerstiella sp.]|nr:hypothetical protein [Fuerstiella sp.]
MSDDPFQPPLESAELSDSHQTWGISVFVFLTFWLLVLAALIGLVFVSESPIRASARTPAAHQTHAETEAG